MKQKTKPAHTIVVDLGQQWTTRRGSTSVTPYGFQSITVGQDRIQYSEYPKDAAGKWPWQRCVHDTVNGVSNPVIATITGVLHQNPAPFISEYDFGFNRSLVTGLPLISAPSGTWDRGVLDDIVEQLDLNSSESVLLYSGVWQAVPLVGAAFKLTSILNRAARKFVKDLRKKPFTTAVKTLISADFVDRFVISPMIDDARKFMDATNYVLRVIATARERNATRFALKSERVNLISEKVETYGYNGAHINDLSTKITTRSTVTSKAFALLEARYDVGAVDPIKFWAQRVGLTRPLDSAWDLVPFSFVIDYFTRAGDFISHLSDKMSEVEGLKGKIARIHGLWGTLSCKAVATQVVTGWNPPSTSSTQYWKVPPIMVPNECSRTSVHFERFPIPDPYTALSSLQRKENWGSLNLSLSSTRKRTIAELIIQAKL